MSALALPQKLTMIPQNIALCKRIGIIFDGKYRDDVLAYDLKEQTIRIRGQSELLKGKVEAYWR